MTNLKALSLSNSNAAEYISQYLSYIDSRTILTCAPTAPPIAAPTGLPPERAKTNTSTSIAPSGPPKIPPAAIAPAPFAIPPNLPLKPPPFFASELLLKQHPFV